MKKFIKIVSVIFITIVVIFFLANWRRIQGWHSQEDYLRTSVGDSKYSLPGLYLTEILSFDKIDSTAEVATYGDIASKYPFEFKVGDYVTVTMEAYSNPSNNTFNKNWFKGRIVSIDKKYIPLNKYPSIKYIIQIMNQEYSNNIPDNLSGKTGGMIHSSQDGDSLILKNSSLREIDGKNYACVVTQKINTGLGYLIKFKLKEVQVGSKVYNFGAYSDSDGFIYLIDVLSGLSKEDTVIYGIYNSSNSIDFNCGNTPN
jgi:hypothetical protein